MAESAGYTVIAKIEQKRRADARYQLGAGKVEELIALIKETNAQKVIFDNSLTPIQTYNLAKATGVENIDRFQLILEIFTKRATTNEAILQIQLAKMKNELKYAKEKVKLSKMGEQPGFMGIGVYEADIYTDAIKRQIHTIQKKLKRVKEKRTLHRYRRAEQGFISISLAGYTNAGKSTLFNKLTDKDTYVNDSLFTTLSTTTRLIEFSKRKFLLTDTVGFIDRLPLTLIEAFHSTLEETILSDLIILVIDLNEPLADIEKKIRACQETIDCIGASKVQVITVFNKIDELTDLEIKSKYEALKNKTKNPLVISAKKGTNIDQLKKEILKKVEGNIKASFTIPVNEDAMALISFVHSEADVKKTEYSNNNIAVYFEANPTVLEKIKNRVEKLDGKFKKELALPT